VVSDAVAQVAGCCPLIDEVISFNREKIVYDRESALGFIEAIRDRKFDVAICPAYSRDKVSDFIAGNSGAGRRIAASGDEANQSRERIKENNKLFTQIVPMSDGIRLETERNTEFIAALGAEVSGVYKPKVWVSDEDRGIAEKLISDMRVLRFVVVAPFAQSDLRKWQQEKWAELISGYADYEIVIVGTGADFDDAEQIKALSAHRFVHNICGQTNIGQLAWIIKGCEFCISLESASAHLAAAVDRCCAVIVGGGHFGRFMPYSEKTEMVFNKMDCFGCDWKCVFGDGRCVKSITVEQVRGAVERMISRESAGINPDSKVDIQLKNVDDFLVSAIVSTYNSERFLCGCLEDLERQTIADRLEVIVVNSGSEENEEGIVKEFQRKYSNIVYIKTDEREGIYTAWNRGVRAASGKYITNANTDDRHRPDAYEVMVRTLEANPGAALVYGDQIVTDTANSDFESCHVVEEARRSEFSWERLLFGCCVGSGPMWRKSVHDELGFFDESLTCAGDWDFWLRIAKRYEFKHIGEVLGTYYNNEDGLEHGRKIHGWYERYIVGRRYGNPYISVMPVYKGNEKSLVSVIIPAYNAADYIGGAIESVLIQNYQNFELIIINDGSTDETQAIIDKFKDERIRCIRQENRGVSAACNEGIRQSMGRYIVRLDADDMMSPDFIAQHLQQFEKYPDADLVYCDDCLIDEKDKPIRVIKRPEYDDSGAMIRDLFAAGFPVVPFRTCIKRSVFDRIGFFDEGLVVAEDYDMMRKFVKAGLKCRHLASSLYLRRMTSDSLSRGWTKQKADAHFEVMRRYEESFDCTQLFCDVNWERIVPEQRGVYADYLCAIVYISIGKSYMENAPIYASVAFKRAETLLGSSLKNRPESEMIKKAMVKCDELKEQLPIVGANSEMSVVVSM
jgi:glycosyltransferase involved in cell wall biosynthesis/ADP-heptose:LPS heptosyltransferase